MSAAAPLLGHWNATGPADKPFRASDPDWNTYRIRELCRVVDLMAQMHHAAASSVRTMSCRSATR